jgi:hypothetical protein
MSLIAAIFMGMVGGMLAYFGVLELGGSMTLAILADVFVAGITSFTVASALR